MTRALTRTAFRQLSKGDLIAVPVGNHEITAEQLAENILLVIKQLQEVYPGGLANIRSMYLKIDITGTSALPLYVSMCAPPEDVPYVVGPREQRMLKLKKQANEVLSKFAMTKDAEFIKLTSDQVKRKAQLRKEKAALLAADAAPKDNDGGDAAVPAKKLARSPAAKAQRLMQNPMRRRKLRRQRTVLAKVAMRMRRDMMAMILMKMKMKMTMTIMKMVMTMRTRTTMRKTMTRKTMMMMTMKSNTSVSLLIVNYRVFLYMHNNLAIIPFAIFITVLDNKRMF